MFEGVHRRLASCGVDLQILAGRPDPEQANRNDAVHLPFQTDVRSRRLRLGSRSIRWKSVWRASRRSDLVICELASGALETHASAVFRRRRFAVWGHGYAATSKPTRLDSMIEHWLMRRARHVFSYTDRGRVEAERAGVDPARITVLQNTVDTSELSAFITDLTDSEVAAFRELHGVDTPSVCASIGGLDTSKRLRLLLDAAAVIAQRVPSFRLVIGGDGAERATVEASAARYPWLVYLGQVGERDKALVARTAQLLLNPGRVGLIAVESFVMGLPIITTRWDRHAPEVAYLDDGRTALFADSGAAAYAATVIDLLSDEQRLAEMRSACKQNAGKFSMEAMVGRFADGILTVLAGH